MGGVVTARRKLTSGIATACSGSSRSYPDLRASDLRPYHVETWADGYNFSVTSRRNYLRSVKRCMKWAKKQGYIDRNPIEDLEVPMAESKEVAIDSGGV